MYQLWRLLPVGVEHRHPLEAPDHLLLVVVLLLVGHLVAHWCDDPDGLLAFTDEPTELLPGVETGAGCERMFDDTLSGRSTGPPGLREALDALRPNVGDIFVVWKLDRLCRSVKQLVDIVARFERDDVSLVSLTDSIDTSTPAGRFFFHIMASLAEMERELIAERTQAGLEAARPRGRIGGRKRVMTDGKFEAAKRLLASGVLPRDVAAALGVSVATLYRWLPAEGRGSAL
jgi:DNA invertase Pin-like site-specific DNA recombinase